MQEWQTYFERNRAQRPTFDWTAPIGVEPHLRSPLIRSLQRFQVGEQGDGVHLKAGAAARGDPGYAAAVHLFIGEEQEHARLLAEILTHLGAPLLKGHWSDWCFTGIRRLMGLKMELMVLLIAEMLAKRYYRALDEGTRDATLKQIFGQIRDDEEGHIAFHCDFLRAAFAPCSPRQQWIIRTGWRGLFRVFCLGVAWDHRGVLGAVGVPPGLFQHDCTAIFDAVAARIFLQANVTEAYWEREA